MADPTTASDAASGEGPEFYSNARKYWATVPATVDGVLGGLGYLNALDARTTGAFLDRLAAAAAGAHTRGRACDCGAGIGRVTQHVLAPRYATVDLVESDVKFCDEARAALSQPASGVGPDRLGDIYNVGLEGFRPPAARYDLVWCQWVLSHLSDDDLVAFLERCAAALRPGGWIGVKENTCGGDERIFDDEDSSFTRPAALFESIFARAGLRVHATELQQGMPPGLFKVRMWMLVPI
ncbi:hypothetical protein CXG81DRAFT_29167 [Caulochytrium protostelioides]|uniref:Alpha N-terminal protein methyltransferase 1 n=1 Tax=Caulochytrium protostelioides TaxID=1555241 RepID=A0A4P9XF87_9FUNG|nr:hypothetical protein CXG81DRAFT_29167 [Caulochytrium protostelioides]|eukprot:RKP03871.1 hypothetical protein CXG81DRAFT_29167 [Caulochytrium protostelioides]